MATPVRRTVQKVKSKAAGSLSPVKGRGQLSKKSSQRPLKRSPPASWKADYPLIQKLRAQREAPVDSVGCERLADTSATQADYEWQCLAASMLSALTRDQATHAAMECLRQHGNTIPSIAKTPERKLRKLISQVGFANTKAKNLRATARLCLEKHGGRIPTDLEGLLALPGVGPKMAHLTLHAAFDRQEGLCVDTHVHRIANSLGWVKTKTPEETRVALESWLPKRHWADINVLLVGLGQMHQQALPRLVERCLAFREPVPALRLLTRLGIKFRPGKFEALDLLASRSKAVKALMAQ